MAHWISSKLKVAEDFLHQIDQQAAESLKKNEIQGSEELGFESKRKSSGSKPLKDQLKKKGLDEDVIKKSHSDRNLDLSRSSSNSSIKNVSGNNNRNKEIAASGYSLSPKDTRDKDTAASVSLNPKPTGSNLTEGDWTELLSVPSRKEASGVNRGSSVVLGNRGTRKGHSTSGTSISSLNGKSGQKGKNGDSNSLRKAGKQLESKVNGGGLDGRTSGSGEVTPRTSSADLRSDGENQRGDLVGEDKGVKVISMRKDAENKGEGVEFNSAIEKQVKLSNDDSLDEAHHKVKASTIVDTKFDLKKGKSDNKRLNSLINRVDSSTPESRSSMSAKRGSSTSDEQSGSETDYSTSSSDSENEHEREERRKRRQQILAEKAAAKAVEAIKERENTVARLEGEKQSLEKILEVRAKQQVQEASELQSTMMEVMEAVDLEKQKHNNTRMEALTRLAKLEKANADLARSLATVQYNLGVEVNRVSELRQQIELKEATHEDFKRKISSTHRSDDKLKPPKGVELEREILEAEYSLLTDKVGRLEDKAKTLETSIESTRRELENPTEVEVELKRRLGQLTDHLIQKQSQVEALSSEKATLSFRIEATSRLLDESRAMDSAVSRSNSLRDLETGLSELSSSRLKPMVEERIRSGKQHFGSIVRQLDSIYCAGAIFLKRNSTARIWSLVYLVCLHLWVVYILSSHSQVSDEARSGAVISLQNINNTGGV